MSAPERRHRRRRAAAPLAPVASVALLAIAVVGSAGCVEISLREAGEDFDYTPPPPPVAAAPRTEGAIWGGQSASGSFLFFDQKARGVGDLVTVRVVENVKAEETGKTELDKTSTLGAALTSDVGLQQLVQKPLELALKLVGIGSPGVNVPSGTELNVLESANNDTFAGEGTTSREGSFDAIVTCRVVAVLPGPVFHIRGRRAVVVNHERRYLTVEGLVRQLDIGIDNAVASTALAEARITLDGLGVIDDKQRPGWLARAFAWLYPL